MTAKLILSGLRREDLSWGDVSSTKGSLLTPGILSFIALLRIRSRIILFALA